MDELTTTAVGIDRVARQVYYPHSIYPPRRSRNLVSRPAMSQFPRIAGPLRVVLAAIGIAIIGAGLFFDKLAGTSPGFGTDQRLLCAIGCVYLLSGIALHRLPAIFCRVSLGMIAVVALVSMIEISGRLIGHDFNQTEAAWNATPIYYRQPVVPIGEGLFRRPGPASWTGKVRSQQFMRLGTAEPNAYANEQNITVTYDHEGFRNPNSLTDWEIVIVGDSFTELGFLPQEDLFSSRVAEMLGVRVKNLGVSFTGTLSHNHFLREYGKSQSTKDAILVFFEGNDIADTVREQRQTVRWNSSGTREFRDLAANKQSSFFLALGRRMRSLWRPIRVTNATMRFPDEQKPITVSYSPPGRSELSAEEFSILNSALADWADIARDHAMRPRLVYMPCKRRVLHGRLQFLEHTHQRLAEWQPTDLPELVQDLCDRNGIHFIDVTPALMAETDRGNLNYNSIWDTHLNRHGSLTVARAIADALVAASVAVTLQGTSSSRPDGKVFSRN